MVEMIEIMTRKMSNCMKLKRKKVRKKKKWRKLTKQNKQERESEKVGEEEVVVARKNKDHLHHPYHHHWL